MRTTGKVGQVRAFWLAATCVVLLAAVLRFWALSFGLPNQRARPDERPVVHAMLKPARGDLDLDFRIYPHAYVYASWLWVEAGLRIAPLFGLRPPGGFERTLLREPELLFLLGRGFSAFAGTLAAALALWMARREWGAGAGLAAGGLCAVCFAHVRDSHSFKPDALLSALALLALAAMLPLARRATPGRGVLAGAAVGAATAAKTPGLLLLVPLVLAACLGSTPVAAGHASPGKTSSTGSLRRARPWRRWLPPAVAGIASAAAVFALTSPHLVFGGELLDTARLIVKMIFPDIAGSGGPTLPRAAEFAYPPPPGLELREYGAGPWWQSYLFHFRFSLWYGIGALATLAALPAIAWGFLARRPLGMLAATGFLTSFVVVGASPALTSRYLTSFLPLLLLLEAGLLADLARRIAPARSGVVLATATLALAAQPFLASVAHDRLAARTDTRVLASRWLEEHTAPGECVAFIGAVLMPYGQPTPPRHLRVSHARPIPEELARDRVDYVVTHDHALYYSTTTPQQMAPLEPHLRLLAEFDPRGDAPERAVFEENDAYYVPVHGFSGVTRPGPHVRIYAFLPEPSLPRASGRVGR